jgi:hypothetical protein
MPGGLSIDLDDLASSDVSLWPDAAISETYVALRHDIDRREAVAAKLLAGLHGRQVPLGDGASSTPAWVQWRTGQRAGEAKASLEAGRACEHLPLTAKAWAQGEISASAARTICKGIKTGHESLYADLESQLVDFAAAHEYRDLDGVIRYYRRCADAIDDVAPEEKNDLRLSQVLDRWVLNGDLDALSGEIVKTALDAATDPPTEHDTRTPSRRLADALVRIARSFLDHEDLPFEAGEAPHLNLTFSWETIQSFLPCPTHPADLSAALSKHEISRLLCDANVARVVLGPDGQPLDVGREHRTAPKWMRRAIAVRDRGCRFPGCQRRPNRCEAHHVWAWEDGGPTAIRNLVLLCSFHHHVVHRPGWTNTFDGTTYTIINARGIQIE